MLRAHPPEPPPQAQSQPNEDPTMKLLGAMLGGLPPSISSAAENLGGPGAPGDFSPSDLASSLGLSPFLTKLLLGNGGQLDTEEEKRKESIWKLLHIFFALAVGVYLILILGSSVAIYGSQPPPPPTAQNPLVIFITGELLLSGVKILLSVSRNGQLADLSIWLQFFRNLSRDGSIALFMFGIGSWWRGGWGA
jgi:GET complex subunit GET2